MEREMLATLAAAIAGAAILAAVLGLFWSLKRTTAALDRRVRQDRKETVAAVELLRQSLTQLGKEVAESRREIELFPAMAAAPAPDGSINIGKRTRALRMHRQGEPLDRIAAALGIPHSELELLVKLQNAARVTTGASA